MKNIYLTEEQYVNYILLEYSSMNALNESKIDLGRIFNVLYRGCENSFDYAKRSIYIANAGILSLSLLYAIVTKYLPVTEVEKSVIVKNIDRIENNERDSVNTIDFSKNNDTLSSKENTNLNSNKNFIINLNFKISEDGIKHIKKYETCRLTPYFATEKERENGIKTIGWGHIIKSNDSNWLKQTNSITQEQADEIFYDDMKIFENALAKVFKNLPKHLQNVDLYSQGFIDACISMIYNCGSKNFKETPFFKTLANCRLDENGNINKNDLNYACSKIKNSCITQNGDVVPGLVKRRNIESLMAQQ